jgi:hypothetical protein
MIMAIIVGSRNKIALYRTINHKSMKRKFIIENIICRIYQNAWIEHKDEHEKNCSVANVNK